MEAPEETVRRNPAWLTPALVMALVALLTAIGGFWMMFNRMQNVEFQLARRIGEFDVATREARAAARDAGAVLNDLTARLSALEARAQEAQSQQLALASMYQELARGQDERVLADIEQSLLFARQQLQLAGNIRAALISLEATETRLASLNKPQFAPLHSALAKDIARLKLLPAGDVTGLSARLDVLLQNVDKLKLEVDAEPAAKVPAERRESASSSNWVPHGILEEWLKETWMEFRQLVRIRRLDHPELPLLAPSQIWLLRENLKLRLLAARVSLLNRDEATFRRDLALANEWVGRYFSQNDPLTQSMRTGLKELAALPVAVQGVDITDSLAALRSMRVQQGN